MSEPELQRSGADQIVVSLPDVKNQQRAIDIVGQVAQLFFYDWEANILDEDCKTDPDTNANQRTPVNGLYQAVTQASKCEDVGIGKGSDPLAPDSPGGASQAATRSRSRAGLDEPTTMTSDGWLTWATARASAGPVTLAAERDRRVPGAPGVTSNSRPSVARAARSARFTRSGERPLTG